MLINLSLLIYFWLFTRPQFDSVLASAPIISVSCPNLMVSPQKPVYSPGETLNLTATISGPASRVRLFYAMAGQNLTDYRVWTEITSGAYDPSTQTWQGTWITPPNGEYVLTANLYEATGLACTGNPAFTCTGCETGTIFTDDANPPAGLHPCSGCHLTIAVSSTYGTTTDYDTQAYWHLQPGYSWDFTGTNQYLGSPGIPFTSRLETEEYIKLCDYQVLPLRLNKDKPEGYWQPKDNPDDPSAGTYNLRFFLTYLSSGESWHSQAIGALFHKVYRFPLSPSQPLSQLGDYCPTCPVSLRHFYDDDLRHFEDTYYAPYFSLERFTHSNWELSKIDKVWGQNPDNFCDLSYNPNGQLRWWQVKIIPDSASTPAYSGPVLRYRFLEAGYPIGSGWQLREDWYLAENIGLVQLDEKHDLNCQESNPAPECTSDTPMLNPPVQLKLHNYYVGGPLTISLDRPTVTPTGQYTLSATTPEGFPYTGYLEAKTCISDSDCTYGSPFNWLWVQDGTAIEDLSRYPNLTPGLYHSVFRSLISTSPPDTGNETRLTTTELPWSQEVQIRVTPLVGDFDQDLDQDYLDLTHLISQFAKTFPTYNLIGTGLIDIFDFNLLLGLL